MARGKTYPKKIKIDGLEHDLLFLDKAFSVDGEEVFGSYDFDKQEVRVSTDTDVPADLILLHEVMHGIFESRGYTQDEGNVKSLSRAFYTFLKDNPGLF